MEKMEKLLYFLISNILSFHDLITITIIISSSNSMIINITMIIFSILFKLLTTKPENTNDYTARTSKKVASLRASD